jgi:hypothetical protein
MSFVCRKYAQTTLHRTQQRLQRTVHCFNRSSANGVYSVCAMLSTTLGLVVSVSEYSLHCPLLRYTRHIEHTAISGATQLGCVLDYIRDGQEGARRIV